MTAGLKTLRYGSYKLYVVRKGIDEHEKHDEVFTLELGPAEVIAYFFVVLLLTIILSAWKYERGIIFRLGRFVGLRAQVYFLDPDSR